MPSDDCGRQIRAVLQEMKRHHGKALLPKLAGWRSARRVKRELG